MCFDEMPYQMVAEKRVPIRAKAGCPQRYDYEYERRGVCNLSSCFSSRRLLGATSRSQGAAHGRRFRPPDEEAGRRALSRGKEKIRVVLDNLNTHTGAALYEAFEPQEARRILSKLEFHYTPKHASWLNQVEIEFSVLCRQSIGGRRIPDEGMLQREVAAWEEERNEKGATVDWRFSVEDAREKLERLYPAKP